jgi:hypothetical protein
MVATPVMSSETTRGITVMRMALTHSVPTGPLTARSGAATRAEVATAAPPTRKPATRAPSVTGPGPSFTSWPGGRSARGARRAA